MSTLTETTIIPYKGNLLISEIKPNFPKYGPLTYNDYLKLEVKQKVGNLSACIPCFYIDVQTLKIIARFKSISEVKKIFNVGNSTTGSRLKKQIRFNHLGRETIVCREEKLSHENLLTNNISQAEFDKIIEKTTQKKLDNIKMTNVEKTFPSNNLEILIVDLEGNIIEEYSNLKDITEKTEVKTATAASRIRKCNIVSHNSLQVIFVLKKDVSKKSLREQTLT